MKKLSALALLVIVIGLIATSCNSHKKTLGCPGMITKAKVAKTTANS